MRQEHGVLLVEQVESGAQGFNKLM